MLHRAGLISCWLAWLGLGVVRCAPLDDTGAEEDEAVPAMKLTPNAAMRARDVSRPRAEHLADVEAAEARTGGGARARGGDAGKGSPEMGSPVKGSPGTETTAWPESGEGQAGGTAAAAGDGRAGDGRAGTTRIGRDDRGERAGFPR